jgi:hypothetical protein
MEITENSEMCIDIQILHDPVLSGEGFLSKIKKELVLPL